MRADVRAETQQLPRVVAHLRGGGVAVAPTETSYGLVALATCPAACARVVACKGRPPDKPFPLIVADGAMAAEHTILSPTMAELAHRYWPGPLSLVLPAVRPAAWPRPCISQVGELAVRVPAHAWLRALVAAVGAPLTATSANVAGALAADKLADVSVHPLPAARLLAVDGGQVKGGLPSTLLAERDGKLVVLRAGASTWPR